MLNEIVALFLGISILFYSLFAGADFGAGILEIFRGRQYRKEQEEIISHAIAPVWEANHVWLILAIVILFNGFPSAYSSISTVFHIPLTIMLIGIILRGCAFTFRRYDAVQDGSQRVYSSVFMFSSVLTPLMLGVVAGGLLLGRLGNPSDGFYSVYVAPWLNLFSFFTGVFTCAIFSFLAAVYLVGEAHNESIRKIFVTRARIANIAVVLLGACVFLAAYFDGLNLLSDFLKEPVTLTCMTLATILLVPLWLSLRKAILARVLAACQMSLVLLGWFKLQIPIFIGTITISSAAAAPAVMRILLGALVVGCIFIFPALFYLLWIFKKKRTL